MLNCQNCNSKRVASITGKCNDTFGASIGNTEYHGYVPEDLGIGHGDYILLTYCLDCGQMQGKFPLPECKLEEKISKIDFVYFYEEHFTPGKMFNKNNLPRLLRSAEEHGVSFKNFLERYIEWEQSPIPPSLQFWEMYEKES